VKILICIYTCGLLPLVGTGWLLAYRRCLFWCKYSLESCQ